MSSSHLTDGEAKTWQEPSQTADKSLATGTYFQGVGGKCLGARLPTSDFSRILGEPRVTGTCFSKHSEKGPTGIYLITISRCITLASVRQLLNVLISCPAGREAGQEGRQHPPCRHPEGRCDKQASRGRMVVKALGACPRHFPHRRLVSPSESGSPVSPLQLSVTLARSQGGGDSGVCLVISPPQLLAACFPPTYQRQYEQNSAFLQLAHWKQSSQTSCGFPLIGSLLTLTPPSLSSSHSSFGKRKCLEGI